MDGVTGTRFSVWAPNARRVSVVGQFNYWDGRRHPMRFRKESGIWELFVPGAHNGQLYKFELIDAHGNLRVKADLTPLSRKCVRKRLAYLRPAAQSGTASGPQSGEPV